MKEIKTIFPQSILVEDIAPRSRKRTLYIARLDASQSVFPRYLITGEFKSEREAIDRVVEINKIQTKLQQEGQ